jgi:hypothetical protein
MQDIGFDVISDLNLSPNDSFNWEGKATSLYCLVAGNVSSDSRTIVQTLAHLARFYQGVFYVPGMLEYQTNLSINERTDEIEGFLKPVPNVVILHHNVVIIDGVAIIGANGWNDAGGTSTMRDITYTAARFEDMAYLNKSIEKLQKHLDVKRIVIVSNAVPSSDLYFRETPEIVESQIPLCASLVSDTELKVRHWVFGSYDKTADTYIDDINYVNNPYLHVNPYWAKRITVSV